MENLLPLMLGWLLGLLSPGIAERIRRRHRQRDIIRSVLGELSELQYTLALVASKLRSHLAQETDDFLDWLIPIAEAYDGPAKRPALAGNLRKLRAFPEGARRDAALATPDDGVGVGLPQYHLPFVESQSSEIAVCPIEFQRRVFRIKSQLDIFNQRIDYVRSQYEKTFDATIVDASREAVESNLTRGYEDLATQAEAIARAIGEIIARHVQYGRTA